MAFPLVLDMAPYVEENIPFTNVSDEVGCSGCRSILFLDNSCFVFVKGKMSFTTE